MRKDKSFAVRALSCIGVILAVAFCTPYVAHAAPKPAVESGYGETNGADVDVIRVDVPTEVPCSLMPDGTVITPSDLAIENSGVPLLVDAYTLDPKGYMVDFTLDIDGQHALTYESGIDSAPKNGVPINEHANLDLSVSRLTRQSESNAALIDAAASGKTDMFSIVFRFNPKVLMSSVVIKGEAFIGSELTAVRNGSHQEDAVHAYQWYRTDAYGEGIAIEGAVEQSYTLTNDDVGKKVFCKIWDSSGKYSGELVSDPTTTVRFPELPVPDGVTVLPAFDEYSDGVSVGIYLLGPDGAVPTEDMFDARWGDPDGDVMVKYPAIKPSFRAELETERWWQPPSDLMVGEVAELVKGNQALIGDEALIIDVTPVSIGENVERNESGMYEITLCNVPIDESVAKVLVMYFDMSLGIWRVMYPTMVDSEQGFVTYEISASLYDSYQLEGEVAISGDPTVGETLTANVTGAQEADHDHPHISYTYSPRDAVVGIVKYEVADDTKGTNAREVAIDKNVLQEPVWGKYMRITIADTSGKYEGNVDSGWIGRMTTEFYGRAEITDTPQQGTRPGYRVTGPILIDGQSDLSCYDIRWEIAEDANGLNARPHDELNAGRYLKTEDIGKYVRIVVSAKAPYSVHVPGSIASGWVEVRGHNGGDIMRADSSMVEQDDAVGKVLISSKGEAVDE